MNDGRKSWFGDWSVHRVFIASCLLGILTSCTNFGPSTIRQDRIGYAHSLAESWKEQLLQNIVRLRYADLPVFLEVSSVINQYNLEGEVSVSGAITSPGANFFTLGTTGRYYDRPTISYVPLRGDRFTRSIIRPIKPASVFGLIQAGWPVDFLMSLTVKVINGVHGEIRTRGMRRPADPQWKALLQAMRRVQTAGEFGIRIVQKGRDATTSIILPRNLSKKVEEDRKFIRRTLGLALDADTFNLTYGLLQRNEREVAVLTRSMFEIMIELSTGVRIPKPHRESGWAYAADPSIDRGAGLVRVEVSKERPKNSYAAIAYRGYWFWVPENDLGSKGTLTLMNFFFSLSETGETSVPAITINAGS